MRYLSLACAMHSIPAPPPQLTILAPKPLYRRGIVQYSILVAALGPIGSPVRAWRARMSFTAKDMAVTVFSAGGVSVPLAAFAM